MLVGGKSHCYTFCFSVEGSCASAHTLACELVVPVKWVRVPQEGRFIYFRAMCQHLWKKKIQCTVPVRLTHVHTLTHSHPRNLPANKQQKWDLNSSLEDSLRRLLHYRKDRSIGSKCRAQQRSGTGLEFCLDYILALWPWADFYTLCYSLIHKVELDRISVAQSHFED